MKSVINRSLVAEGLLFATHGDRCRYLGTPSWEKARWLNDNAGNFLRIDIEQESSQPMPPVENESNVGVAPAGPSCETPPGNGQKDCDDDVALINTLPENYAQPASLPARVKANVPSGSTRTEMAPRAKAPMIETSKPKTEAAPLGGMGRRRGRSGGRQLKTQNLPTQISKVDRKLSPERMRLVLDSLTERPILSHAARKAGIHRKTLEYWIRCSAAGHDGYDVEWQGLTWRFHELCESAIDEAHDTLLAAALEIAMGVKTVDTVGCEGAGVDAKVENENVIIETVGPLNPKMLRFLLESWRPDKWGKNPMIDVPHVGGVLVVGGTADKPENNTAASVKARKWKSISSKIRKAKA